MTDANDMARVLREIARELGFSKPIRVLIVDDDPVITELISRLLTERCRRLYEVDYSWSLDEGFARVSDKVYDVAIVDQVFPSFQTSEHGLMCGIDLVNRCHQHGMKVPFIMLTGHSTDELRARSLEQPLLVDFMDKNNMTAELLDNRILFAIKNLRQSILACREPSTPPTEHEESP